MAYFFVNLKAPLANDGVFHEEEKQLRASKRFCYTRAEAELAGFARREAR
jgi:hypothetical protein